VAIGKFERRKIQKCQKINMKYCLINNLYEPYARGGAETVVKQIVNGLHEQKQEVVLITLGKKEEQIEIKNQAGEIMGKIYLIKPFNLFSYLEINSKPAWLRFFWRLGDVFNFSSARKIKAILKKEKPAIVLAHNLVGLGFLIPQIIKKTGIKYFQTVHDIQLVYPSGQLIYGQEKSWENNNWAVKIYEKIARWLFGSPAAVISPSQWLLDFYTQRGFFKASQKVVIPNPAPSVRIKKEKILTAEPCRLLFVGRLEEYKGIIFLLAAMKELADNFVLRIAGEGRDGQRAAQIVAGDARFVFLGQLNNERLQTEYRQADVLVLPTLTYENQPTVILEAMAAGVPVLASDLGGISELVEENKTGWLRTAGQKEAWQKILREIIQQPELINKKSEFCQKAVTKKSWQNYWQQLSVI